MRKLICVMGVLTIASSAMGLTFFEDFEDVDASAGGVPPNPAEWTEPTGFSWLPVVQGSSYNHTPGGVNGFLVNNNYGTGDKGESHLFGQTIQATASDPVHLDYWLRAPGTSRKRGDYIVELALGDYHAPTFGTVLDEPIPVIAYAKPFNDSVLLSFFDGKQWVNQGGINVGDTWYNAVMDIKSDGTADVSVVGAYNPVTIALQYTGGFDRLNVITWGDAPAGAYWHVIDDITVSGVPEPTALALLAMGGLLLRRRRA